MNRGFTLIEILVVVVVVAIAMSVVIGSFSSADRNQEYMGYIQRLATKIEMARDRAVQRNREWGIHVEEHDIVFSEYDPVNEIWTIQSQRPFNSDDYAQQLEFVVEVEAFSGIDVNAESFAGADDGFSLDQDSEAGNDSGNGSGNGNNSGDLDFPDVVLFSSGEVTPFELSAQPVEWEAEPAVLVSDGFARTQLADDEPL